MLAVTTGVPLCVLGVLVSAQGQILKAALDVAVQASPFLEKEEIARIISLSGKCG